MIGFNHNDSKMWIFVLISVQEHFPTQGPRSQMTVQGFKVEKLRYIEYTIFSSGVFVCKLVGFFLVWGIQFSENLFLSKLKGKKKVSSQLISFGYKSECA